jgi:hypothetical protein
VSLTSVDARLIDSGLTCSRGSRERNCRIMVVLYIRERSVHTIAGLVQVQHAIVKQNCPLKQVYKGTLPFNFNTSRTIFKGVLFSIIFFSIK